MKILDFLRRNKVQKQSPLPLIRTVRPPGSVRAEHQARREKEFEESGAFQVAEQPDDPFMDTGSLELQRESADEENPYETHTWEMDHDEGLRRIEDPGLVNRKKTEGSSDNPYDTIVKKKGWK